MIKFITAIFLLCLTQTIKAQLDPMSTFPYKLNKQGKVDIDTSFKSIKYSKKIATTANVSTSSLLDANDIYIFPGNLQTEVHISINKSNPNKLIASANTIVNRGSQGYYYSNDGGLTWGGSDILENSQDPNNPINSLIAGDPSTAIDANGKAFIETMIYNGESIGTQFSNNGSTGWSILTNSVPNDAGVTSRSLDKPMIAIDNEPSSPFVNNYYCAFTDFTGGVNNRKVRLNRSVNGGQTFSLGITLKNGFGQGTSVQTGPNGEVYVCWADYDFGEVASKGLGFTKSLNGGTSFDSYSRVFNYTGIRDYGLTPTFNGARMNDFPVMAVDKSNTTTRGRIYVCYPTKENNASNGKSIIEVRFSDNQGASWSNPKIVNIPSGRQNFLPWITVDDCDGSVYLVYYCFDSQVNHETNTYVAFSSNGGSSWENQKVSDVSWIFGPIDLPFINTGYVGDYIGITAYKGKAYPIWFDTRNGGHQLYCSPIYKNNVQINGADAICSNSTAQFNLTNISPSIPPIWSTNISQIILTPSGNDILVNANGYVGSFILKALLDLGCGVQQITKQIQVSQPAAYSASYSNGRTNGLPIAIYYPNNLPYNFNNVCIGSTFPNVYAEALPSGTNNVTWSLASGYPTSGISFQQTGNRAYFGWNFSGTNPPIYLQAIVSNGCGSYSNIFAFQQVNCGTQGDPCAFAKNQKYFTVSPNPSSGFIKIGISNRPPPYECPLMKTMTTSKGIIFSTVNVYDRQGSLLKTMQQKDAKSATIGLDNLIAGSYSIEIISGDYKESHQIIVQK